MSAHLAKQRILVVDDAPANIRVLVDVLGAEYDLLVATDGQDGLEAASEQMPDLILLDVDMPGMDGFAVCEQLKREKTTQDIPIIFVTASEGTASETRGLALGAEDYINRPISPPILKARISNTLERRKLTHHLESMVAEQTRGLMEANRRTEAIVFNLAEREEYLRSILESALDAIITTDLLGVIVEFNPAAERLFGFARKEVLGKNVEEVIIPVEFRERHRRAMAHWSDQTRRGYKLSRRMDVPAQRADGTGMDIQLSLSVSSSYGARHFTAFIQDITERKQLMASLNDSLMLAESSNQAKSDFLANMSHEIRTPMNGVLGMIDLALGTPLPDKARDFLSHAKTSSNLLLRVINDILDYSKIEAGKLLIEEVDFYLGDVLADAINLFRQAAVDKTLELVVFAPPQSIGLLVGDRLRVQQILVNLVGNAVKFTQEGEIYLKATVVEQQDETVRIEFSVKDTGIGMTEAQMAALFSPFVQADSSTTRKFGGTGLGLTICKRLVEMMGGEIWVSSMPNMGSTVSFTILLGIKRHSVPYLPVLPSDLQGVKALVVDDNLDARLVASDMLAHLGMEVTSVASGQAALEAMVTAVRQGSPYALVLIDWRMPEMDGLETTKKILENPVICCADRPKLIMMTAFGKENIIKHAKKMGVDTCLVKPMTPSLLLDTILDVFGKTVAKAYDAHLDGIDKVAVIRRVGGAQVLLVEDNPINQRVAQEMLENVGVVVTLASHGQEAIRLLLDRDFELVFMDVQMPVMDGYQATRQLRAMKQFDALPIIAMTAHALSGDRENCLAAGMSDYVAKPIDLQQLFRVLTQWIKPRSEGAQIQEILSRVAEKEPHATTLDDLPGIQVQAALVSLGTSVEFYQQMLCDFRRDYQEVAEEIRTALFVEGGFLTGQRLVHSVKGIAGNLGAQMLYVAASELEQSIADSRQDAWEGLLDNFEQALEQVMHSLASLNCEKALPPQNPSPSANEEIDWDTVAQHVETMAYWLQKGNVKAAESLEPLRPLLSGTCLQQNFSRLERALDQFALATARQHLQVIIQHIQRAKEEAE